MAAKRPRWRRLESAGEGGQAHIFQVEDMAGEFPGLYALKPLKNTGLLERFRREVDVTRNLNHPNILRVGDVDLNDKAPFYVAKWCEAGSLEEIGGESFRGNITLGLRRGDRTPVLGKLVFTLPAGGRNESD